MASAATRAADRRRSSRASRHTAAPMIAARVNEKTVTTIRAMFMADFLRSQWSNAI
jgi:hypothetical protein